MRHRDFNYDPASDSNYDEDRQGFTVRQGKTCECVPTCDQCGDVVGAHGPAGECPGEGPECRWSPWLPEVEYVETQRQTWNDPACGEMYCTDCGCERETDDPMNLTPLVFGTAREVVAA